MNGLYIKESLIHGEGVFSSFDIKAGEIIESCKIIILSITEAEHIDKTNLYNYYFSWGEDEIAVALGFGSIYNHSYTPNAVYKKNITSNRLEFQALREIKSGEEITVNYNGNPDCLDKVWFEK